MIGGHKRRAISSSGGGGGGHVRTHLFFSSPTEQKTLKRKRHRLQQHPPTSSNANKRDEQVQTGTDEAPLDPSQWTGNQRVLHFGPLANRDPYFYYYPKNWDILYPSHFGFFPYRTDKYRGSSGVVCLAAFAFFALLLGAVMSAVGFWAQRFSGTWMFWESDDLSTLQLAGPLILALSAVLFLAAVCCLACGCKRKKRRMPGAYSHLHHHHTNSFTYIAHPQRSTAARWPPPAYPVLENAYARSAVVNPHAESKVFPPVVPGCSTLALHGGAGGSSGPTGGGSESVLGRASSTLHVNPYNTLRAFSTGRYVPSGEPAVTSMLENRRTASLSRKVSLDSPGAGTPQPRASITPATVAAAAAAVASVQMSGGRSRSTGPRTPSAQHKRTH